MGSAGAAGAAPTLPERLSPHSPSKKNQRYAQLLFSLVALLAAPRAAATLVVFEDGRILRVDTYEILPGDVHDREDDRVSMTFAGGGTMTVSLEVVDRIVEDEYERPPAAKPDEADRIAAGPAPGALRSLRAFEEKSSGLSLSSPYSPQILSAAKEHKVNPAFIAAVIRAESGGVPTAISRKGARGLMQLMPATARRLGVRRVFDPKENIRGGTAYLAELAERFGETRPDLVLAAYNAGERAVQDHNGIPPYRETRAYVKKVLAFWAEAGPAATASAAGAAAGSGAGL